MAHITLSGVLLDPTGEFAIGDQVRFTHKSTTGETIQSAISLLTVPPNGAYSINLEYGLVLVEYNDYRRGQWRNLGVVTVNSDNPATTLPELLNAIVPVSSAELIEFQAILADAVAAQNAAAASAAAALVSQNAAAASAASIDFINDLSQAYIFETVAEYQASTIVFPVGKTIHLKDRQADFSVISGTGTGNDKNVLANNLVNQSINIIVDSDVYTSQLGVFIYNDTPSASFNYELLTTAINLGYKVNFNDAISIAPIGSTITKDAHISCSDGGVITWVGTGTVFKFQDGLSLHDKNTSHIVAAGDAVNYVDYVSNDGKLNIIEMVNFNITGSLNIKPSTGLDLDPTVVDFGINKLILTGGELDELESSFVVLNSTPYGIVDIKSVEVKNQKGMLISLPVQNFHPFYSQIQLAMDELIIDGVSITNDRGNLADAVGSIYAGLVLWEGNKAQVDNTYCEGVVTSTGITVYDFYMAGRYATTNNCTMKDCWSFGNSSNTPLKLKKCLNVTAAYKKYTFSGDFFSYWQGQNAAFLLSTSYGNPFTLDLEGGQGEDYSISHCHLVIPNAAVSGTAKSTQEIINWSLSDSYISIEGGGSSYFIVPKWSATTPDVSKSIIAKGNTIVTNGTAAYYFLNVTIENGTPNGGVIDISDNNFIDGTGGFTEVLIATDTNAIGTVLDSLTIDNKAYTEGQYRQINDFSRTPDFKTVKLGSDISLNTTTRPSTNTAILGSGIVSGDFKVSNKGTMKTIDILTYRDPARSKTGDHVVLLSGTVNDSNGLKTISTQVTVAANEGASTIDFTFVILGGASSTITWSGSNVNKSVVDIGLSVGEPIRLVLQRFGDFAKFYFEYQSGQEPLNSIINWDISLS